MQTTSIIILVVLGIRSCTYTCTPQQLTNTDTFKR